MVPRLATGDGGSRDVATPAAHALARALDEGPSAGEPSERSECQAGGLGGVSEEVRRSDGERDASDLKGPYEDPITVCLPGSEGQAIHGFDTGSGKWVVLESVEAEHEGHICGLRKHDLGLLVVSSN